MNTHTFGAHATTPPPPPRPTDHLNMDLDIDHALAQLRRTFPGLCIWFGEFSGSLWALLPDRLVEARTAADLARQLHAALPRPRPHTRPAHTTAPRPAPFIRRPDGAWSTRPVPRSAPRGKPTGRTRRIIHRLLSICLHLRPTTALPQ